MRLLPRRSLRTVLAGSLLFGGAVSILGGGLVQVAPAGAAVPSSWGTRATLNSTTDLRAIVCPTASHCIAVGRYIPQPGGNPTAGVAYSTVDDGSTWTALSLPSGSVSTPDDLEGISCPTSTLCFAAGGQESGSMRSAYVAVSTDGGLQWSNSLTGDTGSTSSVGALLGIFCASALNCVGGADGGAISTFNGGATWTTVNSGPGSIGDIVTGISCPSSLHCVAVGTTGSTGDVWVSNDGGLSWVLRFSSPPGQFPYAVSCPTLRDCVSVGDENNGGPVPAITSTDGGNSWTQRLVPGGILGGLTCINRNHCTAVGQDILGTSNGGVSWTPETESPSIPILLSVACPSTRDCLAVGANAVIGTVRAAIHSVQFTGTTASPQVVVKGSGFGSSPPSPSYSAGPCPSRGTGLLFGSSFYFHNGTNGGASGGPWTAGQGGSDGLGDCIGLVVSHWSNGKVVFTFGNDYSPSVFPYWGLFAGDTYSLTILGATTSGTVALSS